MVSQPDIQEDLAPMGINDAYDVLACFLMDETALASYAGGGGYNTDDHPLLEYNPATTYLDVDAQVRANLNGTRYLRQSAFPYAHNFGALEPQAASRELEARIAASPIERYWPEYID
jgi:hypothetical protein